MWVACRIARSARISSPHNTWLPLGTMKPDRISSQQTRLPLGTVASIGIVVTHTRLSSAWGSVGFPWIGWFHQRHVPHLGPMHAQLSHHHRCGSHWGPHTLQASLDHRNDAPCALPILKLSPHHTRGSHWGPFHSQLCSLSYNTHGSYWEPRNPQVISSPQTWIPSGTVHIVRSPKGAASVARTYLHIVWSPVRAMPVLIFKYMHMTDACAGISSPQMRLPLGTVAWSGIAVYSPPVDRVIHT
jgi:hypothetical protein